MLVHHIILSTFKRFISTVTTVDVSILCFNLRISEESSSGVTQFSKYWQTSRNNWFTFNCFKALDSFFSVSEKQEKNYTQVSYFQIRLNFRRLGARGESLKFRY